MRTLSASPQASSPERPWRFTQRARKIGRAAAVAVPVLTAGAIFVGNAVADDRQQTGEDEMRNALRHDKTVTLPAHPNENNRAFLGRIYAKIPDAVYPALEKDLEQDEAETNGQLEAGAGYPLPYGAQGLVLKQEYQAVADQREAEAQKQQNSQVPGQIGTGE